MLKRRSILTIIIVASLVIVVAMRLISNKKGFEKQLKMISEFNTTIPVNVDTVKYTQQTTTFSANGTFHAMHEISIVSETQGKIVAVNAKTGDRVVNNQVLASVHNELYQSQFELAKFNLDQAGKDLNRYEQLSKGDAATIQQLELARQAFENARSAYTTAKIQYQNTFLKAPFNGTITRQHIEKGSFLIPGAPVFDMVEINKLKLIVQLTGKELEQVFKGQIATVQADAIGERTFQGTIGAIVVKADLSKRYDVEIEVTNGPDNRIKPGMFGTATFTNETDAKTLVIPRKALAGSIKNPEVFVVQGDSVLLKPIQAIPMNDKQITVQQGLKAGDLVVTSGQINLVNGSKITISR